MRWCYLGPLGPEGNLDWGEPAGGNIPPNSDLPDINDSSFYFTVMNLAVKGCYDGRMIDFDAYGLKVNGPQLERIIRECYQFEPGALPNPIIKQYLNYATSLGSDAYVALAAVAM